jgi:hypothetical protein
MTTHRATRFRLRKILVDIDVTSRKLVTDNCPDGLWQKLGKTCKICSKPFPVGCSITVIMFRENGKQFSGGCHTQCLDNSGVPECLKGVGAE